MVTRNNAIKTFWMVFFGVIAILAIASAVVVGVMSNDRVARMRMSVIDDANSYKIGQENGYKQSLYLSCDSMKNLSANLGKTAVSNDSAHQTEMLAKIIVHSNQVNQCLSNLPFEASDKLASCQKFANQTQDYATYLLGKLSSGEQLTASERASLRNLDYVAGNLYDFLQAYAESDSGMFITNGNGQNNVGSLSDSLSEMDDNAISYDQLDYDGPFSDSVERKVYKPAMTLNRDKIDVIANELFGEAVFGAEIDNSGKLYLYDVQDGRAYFTADGKVAQYEAYSDIAGLEECEPASCNKCIESAEEFCQKLGYDVKGVWVSKSQDNVTYVNCATVVNDVIVYPDLIKVAVNAQGEVVGFEARAYLINHTDWDVTFGEQSEATARQAIDKSLKVTNVAKAIVNKNDKQYACYELQCMQGDKQYYVYVDSVTGKEVEIFKIVSDAEGYTVL